MIIPMMQFFGSEMTTATLTQYLSGTYDAVGIWVPGAPTSSAITAAYVQPVKMDELQMLEDGERISDYVKTYTDVVVRTRTGAADADRMVIQGQTYKVVQVEDRPIGVFRKVIMRRLDV